jgi:hypothetical protein
MITVKLLLKKLMKALLWMALVLVFLLVIIAVIIQIPTIQNKIIHIATTYVSKKTHTRVEIKNIGISFPKSVVVEGLYLEDLKRDTLLYAGKAKVNVALSDLLSHKITIHSVVLEETTIKLYNSKNNPLFNYHFLLTAFNDTIHPAKTDSLSATKWRFSLDQVELKNVRFSYNDEYSGMNAFITITKSELSVDEFNPGQSKYQFDEVIVDGLTAKILAIKSGNEIHPSGGISPKIGARKLQLINSMVSYTDSVGFLSVNGSINQFDLKEASIDLQKKLISSDYLTLSKSAVHYHTFEPEFSSPINIPASGTSSGNNWEILLNHLYLEDNSMGYSSGNRHPMKPVFDPEYMEYRNLNLQASDFAYSSDLTQVSVKKFSAIDQNNFAITGFETDFSMDQHSIAAKKLKASTSNSVLDADLYLEYTSLTEFKASMQFRNLNMDIKNLRFKNSDVLYFTPGLRKQSFFQYDQNITSVSGKVTGQMNQLEGRNLIVATGVNTVLKTDFSISGLPEVKNAFYSFPNLSITSGKQDLRMIPDSLIPQQVEMPEKFSLLATFKGKIKSFESTIQLNSTFGAADLVASVDANENFTGKISMENFDLGRLLRDTIMYGPASLSAEASGRGLDMNTIKADIKADATQIYLNKYNYHHLTIKGTAVGKEIEGKINLNDENAVFDLDGLVNLNPNQERLMFRFNLKGADLQKLQLSKKDFRVALMASADIKTGSNKDLTGKSQLSGKAAISNVIIAHQAKKYVVDSFLTASVNEPDNDKQKIRSPLVDISYSGTESPAGLPEILGRFINNYFPFSDAYLPAKRSDPSNFSFGIQLHNHPILSEVIFPQLSEFQPGIIQGSYDGPKAELKLNASIKKIVYGTTEIKDFVINVNSDSKVLNFKVSSGAISNAQINLDNLSLDGKLADNKIDANISSSTGKDFKKLQIKSLISKDKENYKLAFDPKEFYLMNNKWEIAPDNYIEFGKSGLMIHHLFVNHAESQINIASVRDQFKDDLNVVIKNFRLDAISRIFEKDSSLVKGNIDGNIMFKRVSNGYGLIADAKISTLIVKDIPIGNLVLKTSNPTAGKFDMNVSLTGPDNNLTANGYYIPNGGDHSIHMQTDIQSLSLKTVQAFSMGQVTEATGTITGNCLVEGNAGSPDVTGELVFHNAFITPAFLNNKLELKHETIQLKKEGIYFNAFTLLDKTQHTATIDGMVLMKQFSDLSFDMKVNTKDFLLFNTTAKAQKSFFGRMVVDSKIEVTGPLSLPVVNAKVKMKKGSNFTFAVPEDRLTTDRGEEVVEFDNALKLHPIMSRGEKKGVQSSGMTGFDLTSVVEIDQEATLRLLMDPASTDSLVVKGNAALSFSMDRSGKMSLTGAYNLNDGSYLVSLESVIKKKFAIKAGSTIIWNGDPLEATISIDAVYSVRASPFDLVADQISGLSDVDQGGYKQRYPFLVLLKLRGEILHPEISFEIQLPSEEKGILGGAVNQKLGMLNEDPGALNKQVFALLVLGRFVQENPFQSESGGTSALIRTTVGKFLSAQLNQLSSKWLPGVELNFDIQSYDDYLSGAAKGRTEVAFGVKKQLFNERMSVQVGGAVDVEGDRASQNNVNNLTSDVMLEYKLTKDGRFRLKGFRQNQYEGAIEGQLIETGIGVLYVKDFNRLDRIFHSNRSKNDSTKTKKSNDTIISK